MPKTIRVTSTTFSADHVAPDGSHRFPAGTVVDIADEVADRWVRNGFAQAWHGEAKAAGGRVSDKEASMSESDIDAQIARLQELKRNAAQASQAASPAEMLGNPEFTSLPEDRPAADQGSAQTQYDDPNQPHPLAQYNLTEQQITDLGRAGFKSPADVRRAKDEDLLAVPGVGVATLRKLRGEE